MVGLDYKSCPVQMRTYLTLTNSQVIESLNFLKTQHLTEIVLLSTCHRTEFYTTGAEQIDTLVQFIRLIFKQNGGQGDITPYLKIMKSEVAVRHLFNVTTGLESIVLGEDQILGQVKKAFECAQELQMTNKIIAKFFREAITLAKRIKYQLKLSEYPLSISHIAIQFLKEKQGTLEGKKGLLIGLGQMNELTIHYLLEEKMDTIYVTNRTHGKALDFKKLYQEVIPIPYETRYTLLNEVDFIISATASPHKILKLEYMPNLTKPLYLIDIAMPPDIDKQIETLPFAYVYTLEDLEDIATRNQKQRETIAKVVQVEIDKAILKLEKWLQNLEVESVAKALDDYCTIVQQHTLCVLKHQLQEAISEDMLKHIMTETLKRCIRTPIAHLMSLEDMSQKNKELESLKALFELSYKER